VSPIYGLAVKSIWDVAGDLRDGRLETVTPEWRYPDAPLHALYHRNRFLAPRVRALLDFLSERFAQTSGELEVLVPCTEPAVATQSRRRKRL